MDRGQFAGFRLGARYTRSVESIVQHECMGYDVSGVNTEGINESSELHSNTTEHPGAMLEYRFARSGRSLALIPVPAMEPELGLHRYRGLFQIPIRSREYFLEAIVLWRRGILQAQGNHPDPFTQEGIRT